MRRLLALLILIALLPGHARATPPVPQAASQQSDQKKDVTVYITRYYRAGRRSLSKSSIPISLKDAQAGGYTPCHICHPPE